MDTGADELLDRYKSLAENEKRVLENDEDRLLSVILYNLTAFMLLMQVKHFFFFWLAFRKIIKDNPFCSKSRKAFQNFQKVCKY